jgi:hypothetical protein
MPRLQRCQKCPQVNVNYYKGAFSPLRRLRPPTPEESRKNTSNMPFRLTETERRALSMLLLICALALLGFLVF